MWYNFFYIIRRRFFRLRRRWEGYAVKLLILTANTGEGHNSCAQAIKEAVLKAGGEAFCFDALQFLTPNISKPAARFHAGMYRRLPRVFKFGSEKLNDRTLFGRRSAARLYFGTGARRLKRFIQEGGYDRLICVHILAGVMAQEMRRKYHFYVKTALLATDYDCGVSCCLADAYLIPHAALTDAFIKKGLPREALIPCGIPINSEYLAPCEKEKAKLALGFAENTRILLMMGGSMGCGGLAERAEALSSRLPEGALLIVLCGRHEALAKRLQKNASPRLLALSYTDKVPLYEKAAELLITKPGGISITEAAHSGLPMLLYDVVGSYEKHNLDFFVQRGWAEAFSSQEEITERCLTLLSSPQILDAARARLRADFSFDSAGSIVKWLAAWP